MGESHIFLKPLGAIEFEGSGKLKIGKRRQTIFSNSDKLACVPGICTCSLSHLSHVLLYFARKRSRQSGSGEKVSTFAALSPQGVLKLPPMTMGDVALKKPSHPFSCVDNVAGLAQMLGVPKEDALFYVIMVQDTLCVVSGCRLHTVQLAVTTVRLEQEMVQDMPTTIRRGIQKVNPITVISCLVGTSCT
jgi:hypothetical protein